MNICKEKSITQSDVLKMDISDILQDIEGKLLKYNTQSVSELHSDQELLNTLFMGFHSILSVVKEYNNDLINSIIQESENLLETYSKSNSRLDERGRETFFKIIFFFRQYFKSLDILLQEKDFSQEKAQLLRRIRQDQIRISKTIENSEEEHIRFINLERLVFDDLNVPAAEMDFLSISRRTLNRLKEILEKFKKSPSWKPYAGMALDEIIYFKKICKNQNKNDLSFICEKLEIIFHEMIKKRYAIEKKYLKLVSYYICQMEQLVQLKSPDSSSTRNNFEIAESEINHYILADERK